MIMDSLLLYFSEKMNTFLALLFVLVGSMVERSDAVSCYNCQSVSNDPQATTCAEPFDGTIAPTCSGSVCTIVFGNFTGSTLSKYFTVGFCHKSKFYTR